ncbi:MAG: hypothetical protein E7J75_02930 [Blautia sp.]|nr:hypothetical protein [Blautia sp.]
MAELLEPVAAQVDFPGDAAKASMILKKRDFKRWSVKFMSTNSSCQFLYSAVHIPQELRIRSRGTERHSASN